MIEERAVVSELRRDGSVWVETQRGSVCGKCSAQGGCGTAVLSKVLGVRHNRMRVRSGTPLRVGDEVMVGIDEGALLRGSLAVYAVPLLAMLSGGLLGEVLARQLLFASGELASIGAGLLGLALGYVWLVRYSALAHDDARFSPSVLRILSEAHKDSVEGQVVTFGRG